MEQEEYRRLYRLEDQMWWFRGMRAISETLLERYRPGPRAQWVLDAGCGTGGSLRMLARHGRVVGLDASAHAVSLAAERDAAPIVNGSVSRLPFANATFDLVTSFDVLYHVGIQDDVAALRELARVLRPEGLLLLRVPAIDALRSQHDAAVHTRERYGKKALVERMHAAGLKPLRVTFANTLLFPLALVRRLMEKARPPERSGSEVEAAPVVLDRIFGVCLELEALWLRFLPLPIGLSLFAVATRPGVEKEGAE